MKHAEMLSDNVCIQIKDINFNTQDVMYMYRYLKTNLTKVRPLFTLSHRGSDNSPLLIVFM